MVGHGDVVDIRRTPPPPGWGVRVVDTAIERLADGMRRHRFDAPRFDYQGLPAVDGERWLTFCVLAVSVLACLWPPPGHREWRVRSGNRWLRDAPALFACFKRAGRPALRPGWFGGWTRQESGRFFTGRGTLQLVPERLGRLTAVGACLESRWGGSAVALLDEAGWQASVTTRLLTGAVPGYADRPHSPVGILPFDKLAHLCVSMMATRSPHPIDGLDSLPVYPDYMLPRVLRHHGILAYSTELAAAIDTRAEVPERSEAELAIRWATVYAAERLRQALAAYGNPVSGPQLDYFLWWSAVLGPDAGRLGEHHRTVTLAY